MMVTTGGRHTRCGGSSDLSNRPSSTSAAATRLTLWPISSATSWAVSASIMSVIFAIVPCFIRRRITSTARSAIRLASSWIVIASGIVTSRTSFSFGSFAAWPFRRWTRRRKDATERSRTSPASSAVTTVRRPRLFCGPARGGCGAGAARARAPPPAGRARRVVVLDLGLDVAQVDRNGGGGSGRLGLRLVVAEALLGFLLGLALGLVVVTAAIFLIALARFGALPLGPLDRRAAAGVAFFVGQRAQHHAAGGLRAGGGRGRGGSGRRRAGSGQRAAHGRR